MCVCEKDKEIKAQRIPHAKVSIPFSFLVLPLDSAVLIGPSSGVGSAARSPGQGLHSEYGQQSRCIFITLTMLGRPSFIDLPRGINGKSLRH